MHTFKIRLNMVDALYFIHFLPFNPFRMQIYTFFYDIDVQISKKHEKGTKKGQFLSGTSPSVFYSSLTSISVLLRASLRHKHIRAKRPHSFQNPSKHAKAHTFSKNVSGL